METRASGRRGHQLADDLDHLAVAHAGDGGRAHARKQAFDAPVALEVEALDAAGDEGGRVGDEGRRHQAVENEQAFAAYVHVRR